MTKASHIVQGCVIISALLLGGCSHDGPTSPPAGNGSLSLGFSLRAANDAGVTVSRVNVKVTKGAFVDSLDLTISADSAWGTFANLVIGEYSIAVDIYEGLTLIGTGSGQATISSGSTSTVRITVTLFSGSLDVVVDWVVGPVLFADHFSDQASQSNWIHTTDSSGGGAFQVVNGEFQRTSIGHVFYYNKKFIAGEATYSFKAKGHWVFFWRGTTQDSTAGTALALANTDGTLYYYECIWSGATFRYHNNSRPRTESLVIGPTLTDSLNQIRVEDAAGAVKVYVNNQLRLNLTTTPSFVVDGYIEIGCNHQSQPTLFDDIVVAQ